MARDFNGSTDVVKKNSVSTAVTDNFTMAAWFNTNDVSSTFMQFFINGYDGGGSGTGYSLGINDTAGKLSFTLSFVITIDGSTTLSTGTWYHIIGERSGGTSRVYLNGVDDTAASSGLAPNVPTQTLSIGAGQDNVGAVVRPFNGKVAECAIWTRVLTSTEKTNLAAGYSPSFYPDNLVFYSKVTGQNSPEIDTKSSTTLTVTGTTKSTHPDFMKYPNKPSPNRVGRPRPFGPGIAR